MDAAECDMKVRISLGTARTMKRLRISAPTTSARSSSSDLSTTHGRYSSRRAPVQVGPERGLVAWA
jgi:hypothetical protein